MFLGAASSDVGSPPLSYAKESKNKAMNISKMSQCPISLPIIVCACSISKVHWLNSVRDPATDALPEALLINTRNCDSKIATEERTWTLIVTLLYLLYVLYFREKTFRKAPRNVPSAE